MQRVRKAKGLHLLFHLIGHKTTAPCPPKRELRLLVCLQIVFSFIQEKFLTNLFRITFSNERFVGDGLAVW